MKKIISVIGARPQFIKAAPIEMALAKYNEIEHFSVHTGQHYDENMSQVFFNQLNLSVPYANLESGGGTHAEQTASILLRLEPLLNQIKPDLIIVYGDTNSTLAASLCAVKLGYPVAHIEAGLRSNNREMPEEINRIVTDHVSELLFAPTEGAIQNLRNEGISNAVNTGDVMLDMINIIRKTELPDYTMLGKFCYVTLHRPYNVDNPERMARILDTLNSLPYKAVFFIHPRTANLLLNKFNFSYDLYPNIKFMDPQGYIENVAYMNAAVAIITDSGGIQKEAYYLEKQCITVRTETEWLETLDNNCNTLVWDNLNDIAKILTQTVGPFNASLYGNGDAADIIVNKICSYLGVSKTNN